MSKQISIPQWLNKLTAKEEKQRAMHGLTPKKDGWYKSVGGKTRYIAKPMSVGEVVAELPRKIAKITGQPVGVVMAEQVSNLTLEVLIEQFLASMLARVQTGVPKPMKRRTYDDYLNVLDRFAEVVGYNRLASSIGPADFTAYMATIAHRAPNTRRREIQYIDRLFNWAGPGRKAMNLIPFAMRGPDWLKPTEQQLRVSAADNDKAYSPAQIKTIFEAVKGNPFLNAAAHLGLNCAFIPKDVAELPESVVDLDGAIISFPRGKTGVDRICHLMPETVAALRAYLAFRKKLKRVDPSAETLFFRTRQGKPYYRYYVNAEAPTDSGSEYNRVRKAWSKVLKLPFSGLRSTFATIADDWEDQRAVDMVMGHKSGKQSQHIRSKSYAKNFSPARVRRLVLHVWPLAFGLKSPESQEPAKSDRRSRHDQ